MPAANASMCAHEQGKFWEMHDAIFKNARALTDTDLQGNAKNIGLDSGRFDSCYKANKYKDQILKDQKTAVALGARGTPAFFINGRYLSGAQPEASFSRVIDEMMKKAKDSGVARGDYYNKEVVAKGSKKM
jgi:protein-disulfide isomerase